MHGAGPDRRVLLPGAVNSGLPAIIQTGSGSSSILHFEFRRRKESLLACLPCKSINLSEWQPLDATPAVFDIDSEWERVVIDEPCERLATCCGRVEVFHP